MYIADLKSIYKKILEPSVVKMASLLFFPFFIVLALTMLWFYHNEKTLVVDEVLLNQREQLRQFDNSLKFHVDASRNHLDFAYLKAIDWVDKKKSLKEVEKEYFDYLRAYHNNVDQIRLLDVDGLELIRVNANNGDPEVVAAKDLQNKSQRYYFKAAEALSAGQIYQSPLDLNVERGSIEYPYQSVFRLVKPLFDNQSNRIGYVVINIDCDSLLAKLKSLIFQQSNLLWLLNDEGYWLFADDPNLEWGFIFNAENKRLQVLYPELSAHISAAEEGSYMLPAIGLVTFNKFFTDLDIGLASDLEVRASWTAIVFQPQKSLGELLRVLQTRYFLILLFVISPLIILCFGLALMIRNREEINLQLLTRREMSSIDRNLHLALNASPTPMLMVNQHRTIVLANLQAISLFDLVIDEIGRINIDELVPASSQTGHVDLIDGFFSNPKQRKMQSSREVKAMTRSGKEISVEIGLSPIDSLGEKAVLVSATDVSFKRRLESALARNNRTLTLALNTAEIGVWSWTVGNVAQSWDERMFRLFHIKRSTNKVLYEDWRKTIHKDDLARVERTFDMALKSIDPLSYHYRVYTSDGQLKWFKGAVVCEKLGQSQRLVGITFDETEERMSHQSMNSINQELERRVERRSQDLQKANKELESFSYAVSHDLRSPLRSIDGFSNILSKSLDSKMDEQERDYLGRIRAAAQRMGGLIDDMLHLSRITRADLIPKRLDLVELAKSFMDQLSEIEPHRDVEFICPESLFTRGDSALLRIVLNNLLSNAWKFTANKEKARIELGLTRIGEERVFFVKDNGAGFDIKYVDKLFVPFQRLHNSSEFQGNGIGLATVRRVIDRHGGRVWAEGESDQGATIFFTLG